MKRLFCLIVLVSGLTNQLCPTLTYKDLANTKISIRLKSGNKLLVPTRHKAIKRWFFQAVGDSTQTQKNSLVKVLHKQEKNNNWLGFKSPIANDYNLQACPKATLARYKHEVRFANKNFNGWEHWKLEPGSGADTYHFKSRSTGGYLCIANKKILHLPDKNKLLVKRLFIDSANTKVLIYKAANPPPLTSFDPGAVIFDNITKTIEKAQDREIKSYLKRVIPALTAWTSQPETPSYYAFKKSYSMKQAPVFKTDDLFRPGSQPLEKKVGLATFIITINPHHQISLRDLENLAGKTVFIKSVLYDRYLRATKTNTGDVLLADVTNPQQNPDAQFKILGPKNVNGEYWIGIQSKTLQTTLKGYPGKRGKVPKHGVRFHSKEFKHSKHSWVHWELSGASITACRLKHRKTNKFLNVSIEGGKARLHESPDMFAIELAN